MWKVGTLCLKLCHDWPQVRVRAKDGQDAQEDRNYVEAAQDNDMGND